MFKSPIGRTSLDYIGDELLRNLFESIPITVYLRIISFHLGLEIESSAVFTLDEHNIIDSRGIHS